MRGRGELPSGDTHWGDLSALPSHVSGASYMLLELTLAVLNRALGYTNARDHQRPRRIAIFAESPIPQAEDASQEAQNSVRLLSCHRPALVEAR